MDDGTAQTDGRDELQALRRRIAELEAKEAECRLVAAAFGDMQKLYRTVFENTGTATVVIEEDTTLSMVNAEFLRLSGYAKSEVEGIMSWRDFVRGSDIEPMKQYYLLRKSAPEAASKTFEFTLVDRSGAARDVIATVAVIPGTAKSLASFLDVTDRRRAALERERLFVQFQELLVAVTRSKKEWQETFDSITDLIYIADRNYNIIKANKACTDYFGIDPKDLPGRKCHQLFHCDAAPPRSCPHTRALREKRVVTDEVLEPGGTRLFRTTAFPYYSPEGEALGAIVIKRDITEDREKELRLIFTERLASLGELASGIAHEINNPLASIAGCAEGLLKRLRNNQFDPRRFDNYLKIIEEEVQRCKKITTTMLSFVRQPTYDKKAINLQELLDKTVELIGFQGRLKEVRILRRYAAGMPSVIGSEGELRQVFMALITNALDAMGDTGVLTLETRFDGRRAVAAVGDTGPGIPPERRGSIFEPFFTTKATTGGTGLGLSIVRKIVQSHNGEIAVSSEPGQGAVFSLSLPL